MKIPIDTLTWKEREALKHCQRLDSFLWSFAPEVEAAVHVAYGMLFDDEVRKRKPTAAEVEKRQACIKVILLNLLRSWHMGHDEWTSVSLSRGSYSKGNGLNPLVSYRQLMATWDGLNAAGYIDYVIGNSSITASTGFTGKQHGYNTRMRATAKAIGFLRDDHGLTLDMTCHLLAKEAIHLRDENGTDMAYEDSPDTIRMRDNLMRINLLLSKTAIGLNMGDDRFREVQDEARSNKRETIDLTANYLQRIFSHGSFKQGGRFYRVWWLMVRSEYRPLITLDGEPTVEVDYVGMNPAMLYARKGEELTTDPYALDGTMSGIERGDLKGVFYRLMFGTKLPTVKPDDLSLPSGVEYGQVVQAVMDRHHVIRDYFCRGISGTLQYQDSSITEEVLLQLTTKNIPALPIHDSFIVKKDDQQVLEEVMTQVFFDHTGVMPRLRVS